MKTLSELETIYQTRQRDEVQAHGAPLEGTAMALFLLGKLKEAEGLLRRAVEAIFEARGVLETEGFDEYVARDDLIRAEVATLLSTLTPKGDHNAE